MMAYRCFHPKSLGCWALGWLALSLIAQGETYLITDLRTLGGTGSGALAINNMGVVAGYAYSAAGQRHAVVLSNNVLSDLAPQVGTNSACTDINELGEVAGWRSSVEGGPNRAFVLTRERFTDLAGLLPESTSSVARGINSLGTVVGEHHTADGRQHPFIYANGMLPLGFAGAALAVNDAGQIGGFEAAGAERLGFIISGVQRIDVSSLGRGDTYVARINENGIAVGRSRTREGEYHGFIYQNGSIHDLGTLGGSTSEALGINNGGRVVGSAEDKAGERRAFLYRKGIMRDLNAFLPRDSGWLLTVAYAINDTGQIVGEGQIKGETHGFIMTPNELEMGLYPGLTMTGKIGRSYRIEYQDALHPTNSWKFLTNFVLPASPHFFIDVRPVLFENRVYRSVLLPE